MSSPDDNLLEELSREEMQSALFANLVFQNTNMALLCLGRVPHPDTGEKKTDLRAAEMFIDQLEMLETKTKGNLSREEEQLLKESLTHLRLVFVEAVQASPDEKKASKEGGAQTPPQTQEQPGGDARDDSHKRFTRKY